jgi:RNA polymerase sigma-70 factor (ECF subfamily)
VDAFQRYDVDQIVGLLRDDAALSMPPYAFWLQGPADIRDWLLGQGSGCRGSRLVATQACGLPAFGQYRASDEPGLWKPWALTVLEVDSDRITGWNSFLDTEHLFPLFGLPPQLTDR